MAERAYHGTSGVGVLEVLVARKVELRVRECISGRSGETYWVIEDDYGAVEVFHSTEEATAALEGRRIGPRVEPLCAEGGAW